jgi:hypothetical protein
MFDWKDLIKEASLVLVIGAFALYICGHQFYLSLFHGFDNVGVYFVVPFENALIEGLVPLGVVIPAVLLACILGKISSRFLECRTRHLLVILLVLTACFIPEIGQFFDAPSLGEGLSCWQRSLLAILGMVTFGLLYSVEALGHSAKFDVFRRYVVFGAIGFLFYFASYYSALLGRAAVERARAKPRAEISFTDDLLRKKYAGSVFVPLMEDAEQLVAARFEPSPNGQIDRNGKLSVLKRSVISAVDFRKP